MILVIVFPLLKLFGPIAIIIPSLFNDIGDNMYTYTVRPMAEKTYCIESGSVQFIGAGASLTIRRDNKVVKQFPRFSSETKAHRAARLWFFMRGIIK